jgi:superfamily I DNA/RNA helicase
MVNLITDQEIEIAGHDILDKGQHFNPEQNEFMKCLDSCCVQAYAGTGKTSTVVGKLHVLAQKDIWSNGRGICVISHTNVAVDEIKKHVSRHYPAIMAYPNFVGTIHEFINRYLFIPYLSSLGLQIRYQDNSRYFDYKNEIADKIVIQRIVNKLKQLNHGDGAKRAIEEFYKRIQTSYINNDKLYAEGKKGATEFDLSTKKVPQALIVHAFSDAIKKQHEKGSFLFVESFVYANKYLEINPLLKDIISQRFQFVFLDEAQDCSEMQIKILNGLFRENSNTIFQQIGDVNQEISETAWEPKDLKYLGKSMRFGCNLANFINQFKVETGYDMEGNDKVTKKYLIIYDASKKEEVLSKYSEIIRVENILFNADMGFFAISKEHDQLNEYYSDYSEEVAKAKNKKAFYRFEADIEYLDLITEEAIRKNGSHYVSNILFSLLYKHYKKSGGSWGEIRELLRNGEKADTLRNLVLKIVNDILINKHITDIDRLQIDLNDILGEDEIDLSRSGGTCHIKANLPPDNVFVGNNGIKINIGTIHSVKGQTHNATLLLSNKSDGKQDIQHVIDDTPARTPEYKRLIYVASSRPKYIFGFAIEKSAYDGLTGKSIFDDFEKITI